MTRPFFSRDRIGHLDLFEKTIDQAIKVTIERNRAGYPVDFQVNIDTNNGNKLLEV
jgi:hypothetical protein